MIFFDPHAGMTMERWYTYSGGVQREEVATMKGMKLPKMSRRTMMAANSGKRGVMLRRSANRIAHIITHHGKVRVGRKGRTG
jgi:hypothetical protein